MRFYSLLKIVDVDQLNVKLILAVFKVGLLFLRERFKSRLLQSSLELIELVAKGMQTLSPFIAFPGKLRDVCLNHSIYNLVVKKCRRTSSGIYNV
jgi:hypothetical protein